MIRLCLNVHVTYHLSVKLCTHNHPLSCWHILIFFNIYHYMTLDDTSGSVLFIAGLLIGETNTME